MLVELSWVTYRNIAHHIVFFVSLLCYLFRDHEPFVPFSYHLCCFVLFTSVFLTFLPGPSFPAPHRLPTSLPPHSYPIYSLSALCSPASTPFPQSASPRLVPPFWWHWIESWCWWHFSEHLTVKSYTVFICQQSYLLLFGIPSPTHSFFPGLKPSFSTNLSHCSPSFLST